MAGTGHGCPVLLLNRKRELPLLSGITRGRPGWCLATTRGWTHTGGLLRCARGPSPLTCHGQRRQARIHRPPVSWWAAPTYLPGPHTDMGGRDPGSPPPQPVGPARAGRDSWTRESSTGIHTPSRRVANWRQAEPHSRPTAGSPKSTRRSPGGWIAGHLRVDRLGSGHERVSERLCPHRMGRMPGNPRTPSRAQVGRCGGGPGSGISNLSSWASRCCAAAWYCSTRVSTRCKSA